MAIKDLHLLRCQRRPAWFSTQEHTVQTQMQKQVHIQIHTQIQKYKYTRRSRIYICFAAKDGRLPGLALWSMHFKYKYKHKCKYKCKYNVQKWNEWNTSTWQWLNMPGNTATSHSSVKTMYPTSCMLHGSQVKTTKMLLFISDQLRSPYVTLHDS